MRFAKAALVVASFVILLGSASLIVGSLMGGGYSSSDDRKTANPDPRSVAIELLIVEDLSASASAGAAPNPLLREIAATNGAALTAQEFDTLRSKAITAAESPSPPVRLSRFSVLVQHGEVATLQWTRDSIMRRMTAAASVLQKNAVRLCLSVEQHASSENGGGAALETVFTLNSGAVALNAQSLPGLPDRLLITRATIIDAQTP
ncbi:MAG TPA: hypothetical protein DEB06_06910 [Phycisphaerales bacterium]|nr:hypothetical protein [Phycisphaerales bacterium]